MTNNTYDKKMVVLVDGMKYGLKVFLLYILCLQMANLKNLLDKNGFSGAGKSYI